MTVFVHTVNKSKAKAFLFVSNGLTSSRGLPLVSAAFFVEDEMSPEMSCTGTGNRRIFPQDFYGSVTKTHNYPVGFLWPRGELQDFPAGLCGPVTEVRRY